MAKPAKSKAAARRGEAGDHLLASLSHELRTPLNGVLGMADLLAGTRLDAHQRAYLTALRESGEHLLGLVNDVLDLAKIESLGFALHPAATDVERLLQGTVELLSPRAHAKGLEIAWAAEAGLPRVWADAGRLRQILLNLAGNAVKFTDAGGVLVSASRAETTGEGLALRFSVRDTGPGVAEAERERIFEPFAQGAMSRPGQIESTGLGLAIVRRLAEAFGGRIELESQPGHGAEFCFEAVFPEAVAAEPDRSLAGLTIAVVGAHPILAEAAARQIEACGGIPLRFASAVRARAAPEGCPVLVDYGGRAQRRPRPVPGHPSIILLRPEERARIPSLKRAGFSGYLIKPLRRQSLAVRILAIAGTRPAPQARPAIEDERARSAPARGARVLLAEDNPINAILGRALLEREGCVVDRVQTGPEAVEAARSQAYDLILLDLRMPGLGGLEAAAAIRREGVTTPIAAITADAFEDTRLKCLEAGRDDFPPKPIEPAALRAALARWTCPPGEAKLAS